MISKLDDKGCRGSPDLILEVISPGTSKKDLKDIFFIYENHGVKEYWVVDPLEKYAMLHKLNSNKKYNRPDIYAYTVLYLQISVLLFLITGRQPVRIFRLY